MQYLTEFTIYQNVYFFFAKKQKSPYNTMYFLLTYQVLTTILFQFCAKFSGAGIA